MELSLVQIKERNKKIYFTLGLSAEECEDLKSYVHYRKPIQKWNTNLITRKDYNYALDFLDTIDLDIPAGITMEKLVMQFTSQKIGPTINLSFF